MILECDEVQHYGMLKLIKYKTLWIITEPDQTKYCESLLNVIKFKFVDHKFKSYFAKN